MTTAVIYTNGSQECERMASLLASLDDVSEFLEYRLDKHFNESAFLDEFGAEATYPQVAFGNQHIGDMKTTLRFLSDKGMFVW